MKLKRFFSFLLFATVITAFTACDEDEDTSSTVGKNTSSTCPKVPSSHFLRDFITSRSKEP